VAAILMTIADRGRERLKRHIDRQEGVLRASVTSTAASKQNRRG
jgi:hypothetical protein